MTANTIAAMSRMHRFPRASPENCEFGRPAKCVFMSSSFLLTIIFWALKITSPRYKSVFFTGNVLILFLYLEICRVDIYDAYRHRHRQKSSFQYNSLPAFTGEEVQEASSQSSTCLPAQYRYPPRERIFLQCQVRLVRLIMRAVFGYRSSRHANAC